MSWNWTKSDSCLFYVYLMKWTKSTLHSLDFLDPFTKPDRSDIFTDNLNINAIVAELTDDFKIFLATFLSLLNFDHLIVTLHSHSCFTCSSIRCSLINWNSLKQNKNIRRKKGRCRCRLVTFFQDLQDWKSD